MGDEPTYNVSLGLNEKQLQNLLREAQFCTESEFYSKETFYGIPNVIAYISTLTSVSDTSRPIIFGQPVQPIRLEIRAVCEY